MITLEQIKNDYAKINDYSSWESMIRIYVKHSKINEIISHENKVMKIYAKECLKLASENACLEIGINEIDKQSITNENNIIK